MDFFSSQPPPQKYIKKDFCLNQGKKKKKNKPNMAYRFKDCNNNQPTDGQKQITCGEFDDDK